LKIKTTAQIITIGGICSTLSVILQLAPIYFPGLGLILSPLSSLPVIFAALYSVICGSFVYLCTGFIILIISPHESVIFLLTTGVFGLALGINYNKNCITAVIISGSVLFSGINILTYLIGIAAFGDALTGVSLYKTEIIIFIFSFIYSVIWMIILKFIIRRIDFLIR
jgi:hypothetical protein